MSKTSTRATKARTTEEAVVTEEAMLDAIRVPILKLLLDRVGQLEQMINGLRDDLFGEVMTQRLVVVGPDGFERVVAEARDDIGSVSVKSRKEMRISLIADEQECEGSAQLYLSAGGNRVGSFSVVEDGRYTTDATGESHIDPDTLEYVTR